MAAYRFSVLKNVPAKKCYLIIKKPVTMLQPMTSQ